jgi:hypothetical protein
MYKCSNCNQQFQADEVTGYNINNDITSLSEPYMENELYNPDYCVKILCNECEEGENK